MHHKRTKPHTRRGHNVRCGTGTFHKPYKNGWVPRAKRLRHSERRKLDT